MPMKRRVDPRTRTRSCMLTPWRSCLLAGGVLLLAVSAAQACGWYLLRGCQTCPDIPWQQMKAFETLAACEEYRENPKRRMEIGADVVHTMCVTSNDPRLTPPSPKR